MPRRLPSPASLAVTGLLLVAIVVWTALTMSGSLEALDQTAVRPGLDPQSTHGQIAAAFALVTWPGIPYAVLAALAFWSAQRRLRNLATASALAIALNWGATFLLKNLFDRPHPPGASEVITASGWAYPSAHVAAMTVTVTMITAATVVVKARPGAQRLAVCLGVGWILLVAHNRWVLGAHWVTDIVAGLLLGWLVTAVSLIVARVHVLPDHLLPARPFRVTRGHPAGRSDPQAPEPAAPRRCAVIFNPTKILDTTTFRRHLTFELEKQGWEPPLWLESTRDDPGYEMTEIATGRKVDLVMAAGGDGTIRAVCQGMAGSGIPVAILPAGTGNLLARNLGIPLDEADALRLALGDSTHQIDLVQLTVDPGTPQEARHVFAVMAGIGVDAAIMESTDPDLKRTVGYAAYFLAAAQNAKHPALPVTVQVDDGKPFKRRAALLLIGNVGIVSGNLTLIPGADATDGLLDVLVASPRTVTDWVRLTTKVLTRRRDSDDRLDHLQGRRVTITSEKEDFYQLDGDTAGRCSTLVAEVLPGTLTLKMPG